MQAFQNYAPAAFGDINRGSETQLSAKLRVLLGHFEVGAVVNPIGASCSFPVGPVQPATRASPKIGVEQVGGGCPSFAVDEALNKSSYLG